MTFDLTLELGKLHHVLTQKPPGLLLREKLLHPTGLNRQTEKIGSSTAIDFTDISDIALPEWISPVIFRTDDGDYLKNCFYYIGSNLSLFDAGRIYLKFIAENRSHSGIYSLAATGLTEISGIIRRKYAKQPEPKLDPYEQAVLRNVFDSLGNLIAPDRPADIWELELSRSLKSLLNLYPELGNLSAAVTSRLLTKSDTGVINNSLEAIRKSHNLESASLAVNSLAGNHFLQAEQILSQDGITVVMDILNDRSVIEQPLVFSAPEREALSNLFSSLAQNWPAYLQSNTDKTLAVSLSHLFNLYPELNELAGEIFSLVSDSVRADSPENSGYFSEDIPLTALLPVLGINASEIPKLRTALIASRFLNRHVQTLPAPDQKEILLGLLSGTQGDSGIRRMKVLEAVFSTQSTHKMRDKLKSFKLDIAQAADLLDDESIIRLAEILSKHATYYRYQLGLLLTKIPFSKIPPSMRDRLQPALSVMEMSIQTEHGVWNLCTHSEERLLKSGENGALVLVNDHLLVKIDGRLTALCLNTFTTPGGQTFLAGNWYSPLGASNREAIRNAHDAGTGRIQVSGDWVMIRPLEKYQDKTPEDLLTQSRKYAQEIPDGLAANIGDLTRKAYREKYEERKPAQA